MSGRTDVLVRSLNDVPVGMGLFCAAVSYGLYGWTDTPPDAAWVGASGLMFFGLYTLNRWTDLDEDRHTQPDRAAFVESTRWLLSTSAALATSTAVVLATWTNVSWPAWVPAVAAVPLYAVRWLPGKRRLKDVLAVKNVFVSVVTVYGTAGIGAAVAGWPSGTSGYLVFAMVRVMLNNVLCDVPDAAGDRAQGVETIPVVIGPRRTIRALRLANLAVTVAMLAMAWPAQARVVLVVAAGIAGEATLRAAANGQLRGAKLKTVADLEVAAWPLYLLVGSWLG